MKRRFMFAILFLLLCFCASVCQAESLVSFVQSSSSDRVHLRAEPNGKSESLGLYFTGTPVIRLYKSENGWAQVMIGAEKGYMYEKLLTDAKNAKQPELQWKRATVKSSPVSMVSDPSDEGSFICQIPSKEKVAVLGETVDRWYYIKYGDHFGYVPSKSLKISKSVYQETDTELLDVPIAFPKAWYFHSGAGAWGTEIMVFPDGRFWGYYHDANMGENSEEYLHGTLYECSFTGKFAFVRKFNDWEFYVSVQNLNTFGINGKKTVFEDTLIITDSSSGISEGALFSLFLPGTPRHMLPNDYCNIAADTSHIVSLYGHFGKTAWVE